jgi:FKBP-type peptidyl-prolyl cis-trans isomerase FklB
MKKRTLIFVASIAAVAMVSCSKVPGTGKPDLKNNVDSFSYALGYMEANQFIEQFSGDKSTFDTIDFQKFASAFAQSKLAEKYLEFRKQQFDTLSEAAYMNGFLNQLAFNKNGVYDETSADVVLRKQFDSVRAKQTAAENEAAQANLEKGNAFLAENKTKQGVITTESGLQYQIMTEGKGPKPTLASEVKCHYHGTLIDGTVFDSSVDRGEPATFPVGGVIKGWTEALQMMPVGSKWKLFIPSELAYGNQKRSETLPANSTLIFEVELLEILKK